jgi:hypothetical protein
MKRTDPQRPSASRSSPRALVEPIEPRLHLSGDVHDHDEGSGSHVHGPAPLTSEFSRGPLRVFRAATLFRANVNFQPEAVTSVPAGHRTDVGRTYARRSNGLTYGWNRSLESRMRQRLSPLSPDQRHDTLAMMTPGSAWSIAVPSGTYQVSVFAGDPINSDAHYQLTVEDKLVVNGTPAFDQPFVQGTTVVEVADGVLTLRWADGGINNRVGFVQIQQVVPTAPLPITDDLLWKIHKTIRAPIGRVEPGAVRVGDRLYVMGGFVEGYSQVSSAVDVLNLATGAWISAAPLPGATTHAGVATDGRHVYWVGGQRGPMLSRDGTAEAWRYDTLANRWSRFVDLPAVRFGGALAHVDGKLFYFGGNGPNRVTAVATAWSLDLRATRPTWTRVADLPRAADHMGHVVLDGKVYLIGGEHDHGVSYVQHRDVWRYDPATNRYDRLADLPTASSHFEGNVVARFGKIWVLGGQVDQQLLSNEVRSYDPLTNRWTRHTPLPEQRKGGVSWAWGDKLFFVNGDVYQGGQPRHVLFTKIPLP